MPADEAFGGGKCVAGGSSATVRVLRPSTRLCRSARGGHRQQRPCQRGGRTTRRGVVTIVPITSRVTHGFPFQVLLPADETGLRVESKAQAEQVRSVSVGHMGQLVVAFPRTW
ncbi:MAG: type II toxin-antitoxin system PemK/MazF family toxin [Marmoricola sp.]